MFANAQRLIATCCLLLVVPSLEAQDENQRDAGLATNVLTQYFELLAASNFEIASDMWTPEVLERSRRFGITYTGIPVRVDCNSEIVRNLDKVKYDLTPPVQRWAALGPSWYELQFNRLAGGVPINQKYYLETRQNWLWFSYPQDLYASNWNQVESQYFRFHMHPSVESYVNPAVLREADLFIEAMCDTLALSADIRSELATKKIEYYFCAGDSVVQKLTGHKAKGMVFLPTNDIISAILPHHHEITHLLVNIKLRELPLMTLPLLREGIAVRYGGRWGKHASALNQLAVFLYREKLVELDSILTYRGFEDQAGADIVYPAAGVFVSYLMDRLGHEKFFELYLSLSGDANRLQQLGVLELKGALMTALRQPDWESLTADFDAYLSQTIEPSFSAVPGRITKGKPRVVGDGYTITEDGDWLGFEFTVLEDDGKFDGNLLFAPTTEMNGRESSLFEEQYQKQQPFNGHRFGVRFDQNEAGLYDYVTNRLVAKYIWGIAPSDDYFNKDTGAITIRFRKSLIGDNLPSKETCVLLPR